MNKRNIIMTIKSKKTFSSIRLLAVFAAIISALFIFAPALSNNDSVFSGFDITFGVKIAGGVLAEGILPFSALALTAYLLPIIAAVFLLIGKGRFSSVLSSVLLLAAVILLLAIRSYIKLKVTILGSVTFSSVEWTMMWGLIVSISLAAVAFLISVYEIYRVFR